MTTAEILGHFPKLSALVVGDVCLDRWCTYDPAVSEPSRETGIPRIGVTHTEVTAGAGGTVANNLAALGVGRVAVLGAVGDDGFAHDLAGALSRRGISPDMLVRVPGMQTFTYTKLINRITGIEDLPRTDFISTAALDAKAERQILDRLPAAVDASDVILISDQAETSAGGVVTAGVRELLGDLAANYPDKIFWVDSRARVELFRNMILKPNHDEAAAASRRAIGGGGYAALRRHCEANLMMITHGAEGVLLVEADAETWVKTKAVENPVDICGAGDSFSAGAALALLITRSPLAAARFGNLVASITIMKKGTGTASPTEVMEAARA